MPSGEKFVDRFKHGTGEVKAPSLTEEKDSVSLAIFGNIVYAFFGKRKWTEGEKRRGREDDERCNEDKKPVFKYCETIERWDIFNDTGFKRIDL